MKALIEQLIELEHALRALVMLSHGLDVTHMRNYGQLSQSDRLDRNDCGARVSWLPIRKPTILCFGKASKKPMTIIRFSRRGIRCLVRPGLAYECFGQCRQSNLGEVLLISRWRDLNLALPQP